MGGGLVMRIFGEAGEPSVMQDMKELILQPQSRCFGKVRRFLTENWDVTEIREEDMVMEDGKYYPYDACSLMLPQSHADSFTEEQDPEIRTEAASDRRNVRTGASGSIFRCCWK